MDINLNLLEALKAYFSGVPVDWTEEISQEQWMALFRLASTQRILPMVFHAVHTCPALSLSHEAVQAVRREVLSGVMVQTTKTADFLALYGRLAQAGVSPLVVKGLVCGALYPHPDYRQSGDEDLVISPEQGEACHRIFLAHGLQPCTPGQDATTREESAYWKPSTMLHVEVHQALFSQESKAYGSWNQFFAHAASQAVVQDIQGVPVRTLDHTHHLLFLILHALKHFIHSGFGIRQVCDIILFANAYGPLIRWQEVLRSCQAAHAHRFAAALFRLGETYLTFDPQKACLPPQWRAIDADCGPMLRDILSGGIYGASDPQRQHSATITLNAVAASRAGKSARPRLLPTLFPSARYLAGQYPYLKAHPYLLPVAWVSRIARYRKKMAAAPGGGTTQALHIGSQRVELLRHYDIIP